MKKGDIEILANWEKDIEDKRAKGLCSEEDEKYVKSIIWEYFKSINHVGMSLDKLVLQQ